MNPEYDHIGTPVERTIEECAELTHILCKVIRFGWNNYHPADSKRTPNHVLVRNEISDLRLQLDRLEKEIPA